MGVWFNVVVRIFFICSASKKCQVRFDVRITISRYTASVGEQKEDLMDNLNHNYIRRTFTPKNVLRTRTQFASPKIREETEISE